MYFPSYSYFLNEGGRAIDNVVPIAQKYVKGTLKEIESDILKSLLGLDGIGEDAEVLGSAGKKRNDDDTSGDLDIAIDASKIASQNSLSLKEVPKFVEKLVSTRYQTLSKSKSIIHVRFPIKGNDGKFVQLDLMCVGNIKWAKFAYHSPNFAKAESEYKGAYRTELLVAIATNIVEELERFTMDEFGGKYTGELKVFKNLSFDRPTGLRTIKKDMVSIDPRRKNKKLANGRTVMSEIITDSPEKVTHILAGESYSPRHIDTFEKLFGIITRKDWIHADKLENVLRTYARQLRYQPGLPLPTEFVEYIQANDIEL